MNTAYQLRGICQISLMVLALAAVLNGVPILTIPGLNLNMFANAPVAPSFMAPSPSHSKAVDIQASWLHITPCRLSF